MIKKKNSNLWDFPHIIDIFAYELFHDLSEYEREREIYERFFIERTANARDLYADIQILEESESPRNIFLLGDRGTGKSTFLQWFIYNPKYFGGRGSSAFLLDLRTISESQEGDSLLTHAQVEITQAIKRFCKDFYNNPTNELPITSELDTEVKISTAFVRACEILKNYDTSDVRHFFTLFIDDIDYADVIYLAPLIRCLRPLLALHNCHLVFAGRPSAYNSLISGLPDNFGGAVFGRDNPIEILPHLSVEEVLLARLNVICPESPADVQEMIKEWRKSLSTRPLILRTIQELFAQPKIPIGLETIKYPFTNKQHKSMQQLSNGNINQILEMARQLLIYMSHNTKSEGNTGYHIGRQAFLTHFSSDSVLASIRIQDLHRIKSYQYVSREELKNNKIPPEKVGNSLFVCILESLLDFDSYDLTVKYLDRLGFSEGEIGRGITQLIDMQMIEEAQIIDRRPLTLGNIMSGPPIVQEYKVTLRGKFYINYMIHWVEYIDRFGTSNHHQKAYDLVTVETIRYHLVVLAVSIFIQRQKLGIISDTYKISKREFWLYFMNATENIRAQLDKTTQRLPIQLTVADVERHLRAIGIVEIPGLLRAHRFLFSKTKVFGIANTKSIPHSIQYPFDTDELEIFTRAYVQTPDAEED